MSKNEQLINSFQTYLDNDDIESIKKELPTLLKSFKKASKRMDRILAQSDNQQIEMLKLKEKIEENNKQISLLLNNAGQGFLYFGKDMKIGPQYSKEVVNIFKEEVANKNITHLLYPDDMTDALFLESTLQSILEDDPIRQEVLISLLQKEFLINDKYIELEYKILDKDSFMLILTDITAKKELAQKIKDEQQVLKMVVETVTLFDQFISVKSDYEDFIEKIEDFKSLDMLSELRKNIHTYKGLFAQKEMLHVVKELHDFESAIDKSLKENKLDESIKNISKDIMYGWLEEDLHILKDILGEEFFTNENNISVKKDKISNLYTLINNYLDSQNKEYLEKTKQELEKLTYSNLCVMLKPYEKLVEQLALKLDKYINPLEIKCHEVYVPDSFKPFVNSLVHIFRNSVDHGIEPLEERYEKEKDEFGTIKCSVDENQNNINIIISDDGAGIDEEKIKSLAVEKNIYTKDEVEKLSQEEVLLILFKDEFSTSKEITDISGRGVGLASVLDELHKLNGKLTINNNFGNGVEFVFSIPLN